MAQGARAMFFAGLLTLLVTASCASADGSRPPMTQGAGVGQGGDDATKAGLDSEDASVPDRWVRRRSSRTHVSLPLPNAGRWRIDDTSVNELRGTNVTLGESFAVMTESTREVMTRDRCADRARAVGFVPETSLVTVSDQSGLGPQDFDTRTWVAVQDARARKRASDGPADSKGYVFAFGARVRKCFFFRYEVTSSEVDAYGKLAARLALIEQRVVPHIAVESTLSIDPRERR